MKKILLSIMITSSLFAYSVQDEQKAFNTECLDRGNSQEVCICGFKTLEKKFDLNNIVMAEHWMSVTKNKMKFYEAVNMMAPMTNEILNIIEIFSDYENIADMSIDECIGK